MTHHEPTASRNSRGPMIAAVIALCASLPGLALPFMSDDWVNLATISERLPLRTPFNYFRPLYLGSYWAELRVWGLRSVAFHLTNGLLIAACAALVVLVVRRYTGDSRWATAAGVLFALHPYHVENAAWIAARADVASTLLILVSLLVYERWARAERGPAFGAIALFEGALLFKESVVLFPAMVFVLRAVQTRRGIARSEWLRGILPLCGIAAVHFFVLRKVFLGDAGLHPLHTLGPYWIKRGIDFFSAAMLPLHAELIEAHPFALAGSAAALLAALGFLARQSLVERSFEIGASGVLFLACLAPSLLSFQERYFFLPSAVSCSVLAHLLLRSPPRAAPLAWGLVLVLWSGSLGTHWQGWLEAGKASERLIEGLTEASRRERVEEIVLANEPYRVAGAPLAGDLSAAVRLSGGRNVRIRAATSLNLPNASASGIEGALNDAARIQANGVALTIRMPEARFSGIFLPLQRPRNTIREEAFATLSFDDVGGVTVTIPRADDGSRAAYAWYDGKLTRLF